MLGVCATVIRLCFVSVLQVWRRKNRRQAGGRRSLSIPQTLEQTSSSWQEKPADLPTGAARGPERRSPGPGGRGRQPLMFCRRRKCEQAVAGKALRPRQGDPGSPRGLLPRTKGIPSSGPAPILPRPRRQGG